VLAVSDDLCGRRESDRVRQNIFESQTTVHPSHGLMMTLRILHLPENSDKLAAIKDGALTYISPGNEGAAMRSLRTVCQRVSEASVGGLDKLAEIGVGEDEDEDEDEQRKAAVGMVRALWEEEGGIAREVMRAVERGERFA